MTIMCFLFDEYASAHKDMGDDYTAVNMSKIVAEQVASVNEMFGTYKGE